MINEIMPNVYRKLREKARLTKKDLGLRLEVSRHTVRKFEKGVSVPSAEQVQKLLDLAHCTLEQAVEMVCEVLSEELGRPVGILADSGTYAPTTALAKGMMITKKFAHRLSARLLHALHTKIKTMQFMGLTVEGHNAEMLDLVDLCMEDLKHGED